MSTPTATPSPSRLWLYFQETHCMVLTASEESDIRHAANAAAESDIRALETELAAAKEAHASQQRVAIQAMSELTAAKAECNRLYESSPTALDALTAELARLRAEVEQLKADVSRETTVCDTACMEAQRLRDEVERLKGALALGQENCDAIYNDMREERTELQARAERAEAECLEQARLLGMSGEREAALLSKLAAKKP